MLPTIYKPPPGTFGDEALQTGKHVKLKMLNTIHEPHWAYFAMELHKLKTSCKIEDFT